MVGLLKLLKVSCMRVTVERAYMISRQTCASGGVELEDNSSC